MVKESEARIRLEQFFRQIDFYLEQNTRRYLNAKGISYPRFILLVGIYFYPGLSLTELYEKMCVTLSTVSSLVDQLVTGRLLTRERRPDDRRLIELCLTQKGRELLDDVFKYRYGLIGNILDRMTDEDTGRLMEMTGEFVSHIHNEGAAKGQVICGEMTIMAREKKSKIPAGNGKGLYIYCIMRESAVINTELKGIDGAGSLFFVQYRDLAAVVSEVELDRFKPHAAGAGKEADMDWIEEKARAHERIVEQLMKENDLLPAKFCSIVNSEEDLKAFLADNYHEYARAFQRLKGREEWSVKAYLDFEKLKRHIADNTPEIKERMEMLSFMSDTGTYLIKRKIEGLINERADSRFNAMILHIARALRAVSECEALSRPESAKRRQAENPVVFKASYLVEKTGLHIFNQQLNELSDELEPEGVTFEISGPWPPYTFVKDEAKEDAERSLVRLLLPLR
jgi:DNA-binding MarR family transcriptional regulator